MHGLWNMKSIRAGAVGIKRSSLSYNWLFLLAPCSYFPKENAVADPKKKKQKKQKKREERERGRSSVPLLSISASAYASAA